MSTEEISNKPNWRGALGAVLNRTEISPIPSPGGVIAFRCYRQCICEGGAMNDYAKRAAAEVLAASRARVGAQAHIVKAYPWEMSDDERGIILSDPLDGDADSVKLKAWDPDVLRHQLLFWDRFDWVKNNSILLETADPDIQFLQNEGIIQRTQVVFAGSVGINIDLMLNMQSMAFAALDFKFPGKWSAGPAYGKQWFPIAELEQGRGVYVKLIDAIPVPTGDTPLEDVLEFKLRRRPELLALRSHIASVYQRIRDAGDVDFAELEEFAALDRAIADHIKVSKETGFNCRMSSAQLNFSVGAVVEGVLAGGGALSIGFPASTAAIIGLTATARKVAGDVGISVSLKGRAGSNSPFQYVTSYQKELVFIN